MKCDIRRVIRDHKKRLGADVLLKKSESVVSLVASNAIFQRSNVVMLYHPLWDEVDVRPLFSTALSDGKRLILPSVCGDDIVPVEVLPDAEWRVGDFGILEPDADPYGGGIDLIIVPGVAFDESFNRLGRGKGYYDRFLAVHPEAYRLGICFDFQKVESVPVEPFDLPMNDVLFV